MRSERDPERGFGAWFRRCLLRAVDLLRPVNRLLGVEHAKFRTLIELRLLLDSRPVKKFEGEGVASIFGGIPTMLFLGLMMGSVFALVASGMNGASMFVGSMAFSLLGYGSFLALTLFAEFLFDKPLETLLGARPIDGRTVLAARLVPPAIYLALIDLAIVTPQIVVGGFRFGGRSFVPMAIVVAGLSGLLALAAVVLCFAATLRLVSPERFKSIVMRIQIALTITFMIGPNLFPFALEWKRRWFGDVDLGAWRLALPPAWFADFASFAAGDRSPRVIAGASLAVVVPLGSLWLAFRLAKDRFVAALVAPADDEGGTGAKAPIRGPSARLAPGLSGGTIERAGFDLCLSLQIRERGSLMRSIPLLALGPMFMLAFVRDKGSGFDPEKVAYFGYGCAAGIAPVFGGLRFSDSPAAAWILDTAPIAVASRLLIGAIRATIARFVVVPCILIALVGLYANGIHGLVDGIAAGAIATAIACVVARMIAPRTTPFAATFDKSRQGFIIFTQFGVMFVTVGVVLLHGEILNTLPRALAMAAVGLFVAWLGFRGLRSIVVRDDRALDLELLHRVAAAKLGDESPQASRDG